VEESVQLNFKDNMIDSAQPTWSVDDTTSRLINIGGRRLAIVVCGVVYPAFDLAASVGS
jgi:hypothetical protein